MKEEYQKYEYYIENTFKMGRVLMIRNDLDLAIDKFTEVCFSIENFLFTQDTYPINIKFLIDSLHSLGNIYEQKKIADKSLYFYTLHRKFLEFLNSHPEILASERQLIILPQVKSNINNSYEHKIESLRNNFSNLFKEIHTAVEMKSDIITDDDLNNLSGNIKKQYQTKKQEERKEAGIFLRDLAQMRKDKDKKTFYGRIINYFNENSNTFFVIFLIIIIIIAFILTSLITYKLYSESKFNEKQRRLSYLHNLNPQKKNEL